MKNKMKNKIGKIKRTIILIIILLLLFPFIKGRWKLSKGVTVENIRKIKLGMTEKEVIKILGNPFSVSKEYKMGIVTFEYERPFFEGELERKKIKGEYTMCFARGIFFARWNPVLWISINNGKVIDVTAKRYYLFFDDSVIYNMSEKKVYESPLFVQSFPKGKDYKEEDIDEFLKERGIKVD